MNIQKIYAFLAPGLVFICACAMPAQKKAKEGQPLPDKFSQFKLEAECKDEPLISEIKRDIEGKTSILHLMKFYLKELEKNASSTSPYLKKLEKLFACGQTKEQVEGHFCGITLVLKKREHPYGGFLNQLWSVTLADVSPWDGKIFNPLELKELNFYTEGFEKGDVPTFLGINCFKKYEESF